MATSDPNALDTWGMPGHLTPDQQGAVEAFQNRLDGSLIDSVKYRAESRENCVCRFLRARRFDVDQAVLLFEQCVQKRNEARPWELCEMGEERACSCNPTLIKVFYPHTHYGFDRHNRPVFYERTGIVNPYAIMTVTTLEGMMAYHWINMEKHVNGVFEMAAQRGPANIQVVSVLDLAGMGRRTFAKQAMDLLKAIAALDNVVFPEMLGKMFIINAPRIFVGVWEVVKRLIDARTQSKIEIISQTEFGLRRLAEYIGTENLPQEYGGPGTPIFYAPDNIGYIHVPRMGDLQKQIQVEAGWTLEVETYVIGYPIDVEITSTTSSGGKPTLHTRQTVQNPNPALTARHRETFTPTEPRLFRVTWRNTARLQLRYIVFALLLRNPAGELQQHVMDTSAAAMTASGEEDDETGDVKTMESK